MGPGLILAAAAAATTTPLAQPRLAVLQPFTGSCWSGEMAPGTIDTHCFTAVYGGQHVHDEHRVKVGGKTVYAGQTLYSVSGDQIVFTYWNSLGGVGTGNTSVERGELIFTGRMSADPGKEPQPIASRWRWLGPDSYEVLGGPKPVLFRRSGPAPARA